MFTLILRYTAGFIHFLHFVRIPQRMRQTRYELENL